MTSASELSFTTACVGRIAEHEPAATSASARELVPNCTRSPQWAAHDVSVGIAGVLGLIGAGRVAATSRRGRGVGRKSKLQALVVAQTTEVECTSTQERTASTGPDLYVACRRGKSSTAKSLLAEGGQCDEELREAMRCDPRNEAAGTALSWACSWGHLDIVKLLLKRFPDEALATLALSLSQACRGGRAEVVTALAATLPEPVRHRAAHEFAEACRSKRADVALAFLKTYPSEVVRASGAVDAYDGSTPLHWICRHGFSGILRRLLAISRETVHSGLEALDHAGHTPLAVACHQAHDDVVRLMLKEFPDELELPAADGQVPSSSSPALPKMLHSRSKQVLEEQNYRVVGTHSAIKQCGWTKKALRGEGQCYKHTFYGISSHRCMNSTPSLACANKCVFCWRNHANPVATSWVYEADEPEWIVEQFVQEHVDMVSRAANSPLVLQERAEEARSVRHVALSLVGEPVLYPKMKSMIDALHRRRISTFLVTNGQFPEEMERLPPITQLYVSVDAPTEAELRELDRPLFDDHWDRLRQSLSILREKHQHQRTVCRMTLMEGKNMDDESVKGYAELIGLSSCDFVEVKGAMWTDHMGDEGLSADRMPKHPDVFEFAQKLADVLPEYGVACEHSASCAVLLARRDRFLDSAGRWRTWIDFDRFADAAIAGESLAPSEYALPTPEWALVNREAEMPQGGYGFDPTEHRRYDRAPPWQTTASGQVAVCAGIDE